MTLPTRVPVLLVLATLATWPGAARAGAPHDNYVKAVCHAASKLDASFIRHHVHFPFHLRYVKNEHHGNPIYGTRTFKTPRAFLAAYPCTYLDFESITWKKTRKGWTATMLIGQFDAKMVFEVHGSRWTLRAMTK